MAVPKRTSTYAPVVPQRKTADRPQKYFTYNPLVDKRSHLKIGPNQHVGYKKDLGYFAAAGAARGKPKGTIVRGGGTAQNQSVFETPDQIEARVSRMAQTVYDRQKGDLDAEAERMRREAEGRRLGMIDAYKAAAIQNAAMGGQVQDAWQGAANNLAGIAGVTSGSISDALQADLASKEGALSRVGAAGTGFDARSQAAVEAYRAGVIPGEEFTRLGAVGNEYLLRSADNLKEQGRATGYADESQTISEINADRLKAIAALGDSRTTYEGNLRKEFTEASTAQQVAQTESLVEKQKLKIAADKAVNDNRMAIAKLKQQYIIAKMNVTSKADLAAIEAIYKNNKLELDRSMSDSLINQRNASAAASNASANLAGMRAADIKAHPGTGGGNKPKVKTVSEVLKDAAIRVGQGGLSLTPRRVRAKTGPQKGKMVDVPYKQILFEYLWSLFGDAVPKKQQSQLKRKLIDFAYAAPRPKNWGKEEDILG